MKVSEIIPRDYGSCVRMGETGDHLPKVNVFLWAFITMTKAWEGRFIWLSVLVLSGKFG